MNLHLISLCSLPCIFYKQYLSCQNKIKGSLLASKSATRSDSIIAPPQHIFLYDYIKTHWKMWKCCIFTITVIYIWTTSGFTVKMFFSLEKNFKLSYYWCIPAKPPLKIKKAQLLLKQNSLKMKKNSTNFSNSLLLRYKCSPLIRSEGSMPQKT